MPAFIDRTGQRYGRLVMLHRAGTNEARQTMWRCHCDCGLECVVMGSSVADGSVKSCGCLGREVRATGRHGHRGTPTYGTWKSMIKRCHSPNHTNFLDYGGRGIIVCARWRESVTAFVADMGERPPGTSLDRIDNAKGYEPGNCRWATRIEQNRNSRKNRLLTVDGVTKCMSEWAAERGLSRGAVHARLARGWSEAEAVGAAPR